MSELEWGFYGRIQEQDDLARILERGRWFFVKLAGRRRIGKTSLVRRALQGAGERRVLYIQIPDSDPAGVVSTARDFCDIFKVPEPHPTDLRSLATRIGELCADGWIVALDEFQYVHRKALWTFTSELQSVVDGLAAKAGKVPGGLLVLGSLHTEMTALLDDRTAPLFNRVTDVIDLGHLDIASILEILDVHTQRDPYRLLFLWNLFAGVPKFYRDAWEQGVLAASREDTLRQLFFQSSSPLRAEAENWFLRELRGRYDLVLKYVARDPGCSNAQIRAHLQNVEPGTTKQVAGYLKILEEKYQMVERRQPIFAKPNARRGRWYIRDNFLRSWLAALATPVAAINFRPVDDLVQEANTKLMSAEGHGLEQLVATLYEERSRKALPGFSLTHRIEGFWDRAGIELDLVALCEPDRVIRLGTIKRDPNRLVADLKRFDGHIERFIEQKPAYAEWTVERVAVAPSLDEGHRAAIAAAGYLPQDLDDLTEGLLH